MSQDDFNKVEQRAKEVVKSAAPFERLEVSKEEALELFQHKDVSEAAPQVEAKTGSELKPGFERPVMVHRAILGSVERMTGILIEHFAGKWPLWLSPRQVMICPVAHSFDAYADYVARQLVLNGFMAEADTSSKTLNNKLREAQLAQFNYIAVVGEAEQSGLTVTLRRRGEIKQFGTFPLDEAIKMLKDEVAVNSFNPAQGLETFAPSA